ncbi:MAG: hypothetical protein KBB51_00180 [Candidatus Moranbacteria bacterium]|jgi:hypothetical protein|nr:hypothetical protein [Candidatus Moranbacteria bacterium]
MTEEFGLIETAITEFPWMERDRENAIGKRKSGCSDCSYEEPRKRSGKGFERAVLESVQGGTYEGLPMIVCDEDSIEAVARGTGEADLTMGGNVSVTGRTGLFEERSDF